MRYGPETSLISRGRAKTRNVSPEIENPAKNCEAPAGKVDPPTGTGRMKPRVGCWQSTLNSKPCELKRN
jgi:hypothetical protein